MAPFRSALPPASLPKAFLAPASLALALLLPAAQALELRGSTYFAKPPWKATLTSYATNVAEPLPRHYISVDLDPAAGASLAALTVLQIRGADQDFSYDPRRTRAFLGRPRREGAAVPVQAAYEERNRRFTVRFPQPVPPGSTITVELRPWRNPQVADTYLFEVTALPAGPNPVASPVGVATLRIYDAFPFW